MATSVATKIAELEKIYDEISKKTLTIDLPSEGDLIAKDTVKDMYYNLILSKVEEGFKSYFKPIIGINTKSKSLRKWSQLVKDDIPESDFLLPITVMYKERRRSINGELTSYEENKFCAGGHLLRECRPIDYALFKDDNAKKCISRLQRSSFMKSFTENTRIQENIAKIRKECSDVMEQTLKSIKSTMENIFKTKQSENANDQWIFE